VRAQRAVDIETLVGLFVAHKNSAFGAVKCFWSASTGCVASHEVVLRFLTQRHSVVAKLEADAVLGANGSTYTHASQGTVSEVYVETVSGDPAFVAKLARLAVHEMMHNKLESPIKGVKGPVIDIHTLPLAGLGKETVEATTAPGTKEIALMATHLSRKVKQYTGGLGVSACDP
jgi:hypothetical protein